MDTQLTLKGFGYRLVAAVALVLLTFNPLGWSFLHWLVRTWPQIGPPQALAGLALIIGWGFFVHATLRSIGFIGVLLGAAFFAALVWLFISWGWLSLSDRHALAWGALGMIAFVLAVGVSWSHLRRRISGQADVDDVDQS
jgi:hypothetical protein